MKAVLLVSHGSRMAETKKEVVRLVERIREKSKLGVVEYAFLEIEKPDIEEGIDLCIKKGAAELVVLLNFLNSGRHVNQDIPAIVKKAQKKYPQVSIRITQPIGQHSQIVDLFLDLI